MSKPKVMQNLLLAASLAVAGTAVSAPASAQVPGILPSVGDVEPSAPLPIDGMYTIREIDKRIMIENGYIYAVDSWIHALIFKIMPNQIIVRDIVPLPDGSYVSQNLTMSGNMTIEPAPDGSLLATIRSGWPGQWHFDPVGYGAVPYPDDGYPDDGYDDGSYPPEDDWSHGRTPPENPDAGEEPVSPW
ncbi:MAG: hypothetical protein R3E09_09955 [Novosphingobium sp.]